MSWLRKPVSVPSRDHVPPGQTLTTKFPVLHIGHPPVFDPKTWTLKVLGEVEHPLTLTWQELLALPSTTSASDFHCVTGWSRLDNRSGGVAFRTIAERVQPKPHAQYVIGEDDWGYTANLPLDVLMDEDVPLAFRHDGRDLEPVHGGPLRLVVPPGFWEVRGYSNTADPWTDDRYSF